MSSDSAATSRFPASGEVARPLQSDGELRPFRLRLHLVMLVIAAVDIGFILAGSDPWVPVLALSVGGLALLFESFRDGQLGRPSPSWRSRSGRWVTVGWIVVSVLRIAAEPLRTLWGR